MGGGITQYGKKRGYFALKRGLDILFSTVLIIFLAIPMVMIAALVYFSSEGEVIFRQRRVGKDGRIFVCYKFRTMYSDAPNCTPTAALKDPARYVTPVGRILRKSSLDELPQLFNVLFGDMSLVGPRPLIENEGEIHELRRRCGVYSVRPGMTGLAQIRGRDMLSDLEKVRCDIQYVRHMGFSEDAAILLATAKDAFFGHNVA